MPSTEIDRRGLLRLVAVASAGSLLPAPLRASTDRRLYLAARADSDGGYWVSGFAASGARAFDLPLPARGHSFAVHSGTRGAVQFARRPGRFALVLDLAQGRIRHGFATPAGRHFYGHGVFSHCGRLLYASENDFNNERGVIGVYDAKDAYKRVGEFASHGIGPHDIRLLSDGRTLVVANGGILTRPDLPRVKLNLPTMAPSLCYVDRHDGRMLQEHRLCSELNRLGIRHLAVGRDDTVAIAMQYEGPAGDSVPLVFLHHASPVPNKASCYGQLIPLKVPSDVLRRMKQYCGSVCFDSSGRTIAVSAPRGGLVTFWDAVAGGYRSSVPLADGSGVAPGARPGEFLASSGRGDVIIVRARSQSAGARKVASLGTGRWDNHLVVADLR